MHTTRRTTERLDDLVTRLSEEVHAVRCCPCCMEPLPDQCQLSDHCGDCADDKGIW